MRFGCCVDLDRMQAVQDAGYDYVELPSALLKGESPDAEFETLLDRLQEFDIVPEVWGKLLPATMKITGPEVDLYRVERYLRTVFARMEETGGEVVVFGSNEARSVPEGFIKDIAREQIVEFLTLAGRIASSHGITIAVEPINVGDNNIINTISEGLEIVRAADHPFVKLMVNLYHIQQQGEPLSSVLDAGPELVHTHTADSGRRFPGSGSYPQKEFFETLRTVGYNDRMSVDVEWGNFELEVVQSLVHLRELEAQVMV